MGPLPREIRANYRFSIGLFLFKTIRTINPFWERVEFNQGLMNNSNNDLTSHRKGRVGPLSHDMCPNNRF